MHNFDFAPLYRATVGFDQIADMMDRVLSADSTTQSYPPYNIEKTGDDGWRITLAVAGFAEDELSIELRENVLLISAAKPSEEDARSYLHRGIATRSFERRFHLADHIRVTEANLDNGLLHIDLVREVPEALKPRQITIGKDAKTKMVEAKAVN